MHIPYDHVYDINWYYIIKTTLRNIHQLCLSLRGVTLGTTIFDAFFPSKKKQRLPEISS